MGNVERKLIEDFGDWRTKNKRSETSKEELKKDVGDFMEEKFQIKPNQTGGKQEINILDILDTMISPNVEASFSANSIRENEIACKQLTEMTGDNAGCKFFCPDTRFKVFGSRCYHVSTELATGQIGDERCSSMGSRLATVSSAEEQAYVWQQSGGAHHVWIGLFRRNNVFEWLADMSEPVVYTNWRTGDPNGNGDCVLQEKDWNGQWDDYDCHGLDSKYACSKPAELCDPEGMVEYALQRRTCIGQNTTSDQNQEMASKTPAIDLFLNPEKEEEKKRIIREKKDIAKNYFKGSNMPTLYPELFRILWESTLPCFKEENEEEHMLLSCELAGVEVNCSSIFTRVPTDTGMCCALNVDDSLRDSTYTMLVKEMQGDKTVQKVSSQEGASNGVRLIVDLHSNTVSFGTTNQQHSAFKMFIGEPAQFPMMLDNSLPLQPGRTHSVDLKATVVSTNGIREIEPEARGCFFTDESNLEFYKGYTFSNCRLECSILAAEKKYKCIPWHLPKVGFV